MRKRRAWCKPWGEFYALELRVAFNDGRSQMLEEAFATDAAATSWPRFGAMTRAFFDWAWPGC